MARMRAAILGATGAVGQRFVQLLDSHRWFQACVLAASSNSAGKSYADAARWILRNSAMPESVREKMVVACTPQAIEEAGGADIVFSALPGELAKSVEQEFAKAGFKVFSKAGAHRMDADVPLVVPEINPKHLSLIETQKTNRGWPGFISTDPNCSTTQLALALAPLLPLGLSSVRVTTMQAVSGAGYPGVPSLDILDNVVPYIGGEEEKICGETLKILGALSAEKQLIEPARLRVSASCHRVPVTEGHFESVQVEFSKPVAQQDIRGAWEAFRGEPTVLKLPSAVAPLQYFDEDDRPQHRFDVMAGNGMTVSLGRLREDAFGYSFACLGHNTIRGAAGESILQAELARAKGLLS